MTPILGQEVPGHIVAKNPKNIEGKSYKERDKAKFGQPTEKRAIKKLDSTNIEYFIWLVRTRIFFCIISVGRMD